MIYLDTETKSGIGIKKHDATRYLRHKQAGIVCMAYKIDDGKTKLWLPNETFPNLTGHKLVAHNARFDKQVLELFCDFKNSWSDWVDSAAICSQYTFPPSLAGAGDVLDVSVQKNKRGLYLIKKITQPPFDCTDEEMQEFYDYCIQDVDSMYHLLKALPASRLSDSEQKIWEQTAIMNETGIPVDVKSADQILKVVNQHLKDQNALLPDLTDGSVTKVTQVKRIKDWLLAYHGIEVDSLSADNVKALLKSPDLNESVKEVLQIRHDVGSSSVAKYKKIVDISYNNRIYDNLKYYGAATGRFAGKGFQLQNLPRYAVETPEDEIKKFFTGGLENPVLSAKGLLRSMIKGHLIAVDYSSIENRLLAYTAGDQNALRLFEDGLDQYKNMASFLFKKPESEITKDERFLGKTLILGAGYGAGYKKFHKICEASGINLSIDMAETAIKAYREMYKKNVRLWYGLLKAAISAIKKPESTYEYNGLKCLCTHDRNGNKWLKVRLLNGRCLYYSKPFIEVDEFGDAIRHYGMNSYTRKWDVLKLIPGRLTENVVQAQARDILVNGINVLAAHGYKVIATVHDEFLIEFDETPDEHELEKIIRLICKPPKAFEGLPLDAEGKILTRYEK